MSIPTRTKLDEVRMTQKELDQIKANLRKYPDPMPWAPLDSVRSLLDYVIELEKENTQLKNALKK